MPDVLKPWYGRPLTVATALLAAGIVVVTGMRESWGGAIALAPWTALFTLACWACFWRPEVRVSDAGITLTNVSRTIEIPWPALQGIDTRWALCLVTAYGRFTSWSAPAPGARAAIKSMAASNPASARLLGNPVRAGRRHLEADAAARPGDVADTPSGSAAAMVQRHWDRLRVAGHLDDPRLERERPVIRWHIATAAAALGLLIIGLVLA